MSIIQKTVGTDKSCFCFFLQCCLYLGTVFFQAASGETIPSDVQNLMLQCITKSMDDWFGYKLGRQAMRYGQYRIASEIFQSLCQHVRILICTHIFIKTTLNNLEN